MVVWLNGYGPDGVPAVAARAWLSVAMGARTFRESAVLQGVNLPTAAAALAQARRHGLVAWEPGRQGTLRLVVRIVQSGPTDEGKW